MTSNRSFLRFASSSRSPVPPILALMFALAAGLGCSELTTVDTLDVVDLSDLENRSGARALRAGAITDFTNAYVGDRAGVGQAVLTARISDEFTAAIPNDAHDRREIPELFHLPTVRNGFTVLSGARVRLIQAIEAMQRFDASSREDIAELFALLAYIEVFFAENYCSGVPLSVIVDGQPAYGTQLTTVEMIERALADFDSAATHAGVGTEALHLARVGRGRALLNLGRFSDAAAAVGDVPTGFSYRTSHSATAQENGMWSYMVANRQATVADREGGNGLDFVTAEDPRVQTRLLPLPGLDGLTPIYAPEKYSSASSPVVLASGIEARLIEAEALLQAGDAPGAREILNALRATMAELDPLPLEPTEDARIDQLFRERAFWLFAMGHRHGDLRRLVRQYGRDTESVFPTGEYRDGLTYGRDVTLDLHVTEQNNPNFSGCFDRNP